MRTGNLREIFARCLERFVGNDDDFSMMILEELKGKKEVLPFDFMSDILEILEKRMRACEGRKIMNHSIKLDHLIR